MRTCTSDKCLPNQILPLGSQIESANGKYKLNMLTTGNLVIKCNNGTIWSANTANKGNVDGMYFQRNGHVVLRSNDGLIIWQTEKKGVQFVMQNDGNLVLYKTGNEAVWDSRTVKKCSGR